MVHTVVDSTLMAMLGPLCIIQNDKTTLQFGYLLRNDAEYDFGRKGNTIDWPAHTCAELETALKLIQSYPELKGMLDASLAWADPKN